MEPTQNKNDDFNTDNIFDEISGELDFGEEKQEEEIIDGRRNYLKIANDTIKGLNVLTLVVLIFSMVFIYVSNTKDKTFNFLEPICSTFIGDVELLGNGCSGVSYYEEEYNKKLNERKYSTLAKVIPLIKDKYSTENYLKSVEVQLLLDKSSDKLRPTDLISDFDRIKNEVSENEKISIECSDLTIEKNWEFDIKCSFFSYGFNSLKQGETDVYKLGTSITRASLFQKELDASDKFTILEKQRSFNISEVSGHQYNYQYKTDLNIRAKYNKATFINY